MCLTCSSWTRSRSHHCPQRVSSQLLSPPTAHVSSSLYRPSPTFTPCHSLLTTPISNRLDTLSVCLGWVRCCSLLPFPTPMAPCTTRTLPSLRSVAPLLPHDPNSSRLDTPSVCLGWKSRCTSLPLSAPVASWTLCAVPIRYQLHHFIGACSSTFTHVHGI
jgi:hypothetical protein